MKCAKCGAPMLGLNPAGGLQDLCPRCVMGFAMDDATQPNPPADLPALKPNSTFGPYEILETIGRGGMGVVYRARHTGLDRVVALKMLSPSLAADPEFRARFQREARVLASLSHPNIVTVFDVGTVGDTPYLSMEFIQGVTLRRLLTERRLPPEEALQIVPQLCDALEFAHGAGIVHRDIKPENILIDTAGRVKIADFGLAKLAQGDSPTRAGTLTQTNISMGTPHYMAPEQVENTRTVDHRADIYSLGVVLYEMLTGELPLGRFRPPSRKSPMHSHLDHIVLKALEKEPQDRYQRASHVKADLTRVPQRGNPEIPAGPALSYPAVAGFIMPLVGLVLLGVLTAAGGSVGFGLGCLLSLVTIGGGFLLSLIGLIHVLTSRGRLRGAGFAVAGMLVSVGVTVVSPLMALFLSEGSPGPRLPPTTTSQRLRPIPAFSKGSHQGTSLLTFDGSFEDVWAEAVRGEELNGKAVDHALPDAARAVLKELGIEEPGEIAPTRLRYASLRGGRVHLFLVEAGGASLANLSSLDWDEEPPLLHVAHRGGLQLMISCDRRDSEYYNAFAGAVNGILDRLDAAAAKRRAGAQNLKSRDWTRPDRALQDLWPRDPARMLPPGFTFTEAPVFSETPEAIDATLLALSFRPDYPRAWISAVPQGVTTETVNRMYMGFIDGDDFHLFGFELADGRVVVQLRSTSPNHDPRRWHELEAWFEKRLK